MWSHVTNPSAHAASDLATILREQTREQHVAAEAIDFNRAIFERRLPLHSYAGQLESYAVLHQTLEDCLASSNHPAVKHVWRDNLRRHSQLLSDLEVIGDSCPTFDEHLAAAASVADEIKSIAATFPPGLLGYLYVLEGSSLGATILGSHITAMYGFDAARGAMYYLARGNQVAASWRVFKTRLNEAGALLAERETELVINCARAAFEGIGRILTTLSNINETVK